MLTAGSAVLAVLSENGLLIPREVRKMKSLALLRFLFQEENN